MHTLVQKAFLAVPLFLFFTIAQAASPIPIELPLPDTVEDDNADSLSVYLYSQAEDVSPVAVQYFRDDEWQLHAPPPSADSQTPWRLTASFTEAGFLTPGEIVYAEVVLDGQVIEENLELIVPGPLLSVGGIIKSEDGGFEFPDGSTQATAGITDETDPTVLAYVKDGIQWSEITDIPPGLDDGDDDTTYSPGAGLSLDGTTFSVVDGLFWNLNGNAGTGPAQFLGTTDNQALEFRVNGARALRLEPGSNSPNVLGGSAFNAITGGVEGATISGGGRDSSINQVTGNYGVVGGGAGNTAGGYAATIGGGEGHNTSSNYTTIGGGIENTASGIYAVISGGRSNEAGSRASVGGGQDNIANSPYTTIGGGANNEASDVFATVGGGSYGSAGAKYAVIAGGGPADEGNPTSTNNRVSDDYGTVGGGGGNKAGDGDGDPGNSQFATVAGGEQNYATGGYSAVGGGSSNTASGIATTIAGGSSNSADGNYATVTGGSGNLAGNQYATVSGGRNNTAGNTYATVGGGYGNTASGALATIPGGAQNTASGNFSMAAGQGATAAHTGSFVWSDSNADPFSSTADNQFLINASGGVGIGTDSPAGALQIVGETNFKGNARVLGEDDLVLLGSKSILDPDCYGIPDVNETACLQSPSSIVVVGDTAFTTSYAYNTLTAFNVRNPQQIPVLSMATSAIHAPTQVVISGSRAYVANDDDVQDLTVFDISGPALARIGSEVFTRHPGKVLDIFVAGNFAYLVGRQPTPFLSVVDVSDPRNMVERGSAPTGGQSIHVEGSLAFVADPDGNRLAVYDVSDSENPVLIGSSSDQAATPSSVYVSGNRAYVTMEGSDALVVYDLTSPGSPTVLGSITGSFDRPASVVVSGDYAFVAAQGQQGSAENSGVTVFDVSDPSAIVQRGSTGLAGLRATSVFVSGSRVFVTTQCLSGECTENFVNDDGFMVFQFNHLETPTLQVGNLQAGYLDVVDSASVANGLSVGGGLNAGQAYVGGDLGVGGDLRMLGSIGGEDEVVCTELGHPDGCDTWAPPPLLTFTNDIFIGGHWIRGGYDPLHCSEGQYQGDPDNCCGFIDEGGYTYCLPGVDPIDFGVTPRVTVKGHLVPACDAEDVGCNNGNSWDLGHSALRWDEVWTVNGVNQTSDGRLKKNVTPLPYGMADLARLEPVSFAWKDGDPDERHLGLIAQQVREVLPELVHGGDDGSGILGLNYSELVPVLIKAIQEQQKQIEALEQRLTDLEGL